MPPNCPRDGDHLKATHLGKPLKPRVKSRHKTILKRERQVRISGSREKGGAEAALTPRRPRRAFFEVSGRRRMRRSMVFLTGRTTVGGWRTGASGEVADDHASGHVAQELRQRPRFVPPAPLSLLPAAKLFRR